MDIAEKCSMERHVNYGTCFEEQEYKDCENSIKKCQSETPSAKENARYILNFKWIVIIISIIILILSIFFIKDEILSIGLMTGGIFLIIGELFNDSSEFVGWVQSIQYSTIILIPLVIKMNLERKITFDLEWKKWPHWKKFGLVVTIITLILISFSETGSFADCFGFPEGGCTVNTFLGIPYYLCIYMVWIFLGFFHIYLILGKSPS